MAGALEGLRVIELAQYMAGPGVGVYLADQGADVIKVEPLGGDGYRWHRTEKGLLEDYGRRFMVFNRNKRGITLDLHKPEAREVFLKLLGGADVFITNVRPSFLTRLRVDYHQVRETNPRLIYASITAFGAEGPMRDGAGTNGQAEALAGAMVQRDPAVAPMPPGVMIADYSVPMLLAYGIMAALWAREKTGVGQLVETSLVQVAIAIQANLLTRVEKSPEPVDPVAEPSGRSLFRCADGRFICASALSVDQFRRLCRALGLINIAEDPRLKDRKEVAKVREEAHAAIVEGFLARTAQEWQSVLAEADVPCAPVLVRTEVFDQPQVMANGMFAITQHPTAGPVTSFAPPVKLSHTPGGIWRLPPRLGEHTEEVLGELGYAQEQIAGLRAKEVI